MGGSKDKPVRRVRHVKSTNLFYLGKVESSIYSPPPDDEKPPLAIEEAVSKGNKVFSYYRVLRATWSVINKAVKLAGDTIKFGSDIFPPFRVATSGFMALLVFLELIYVSKETLNRKIVRGINAFVSGAAGIIAFGLSFNPVTAPIGGLLIAGSSFIGLLKDIFFLYKADRDLDRAKLELVLVRKVLERGSDVEKKQVQQDVVNLEQKIVDLKKDKAKAEKDVVVSGASFVATALFAVGAAVALGLVAVPPLALLVISAVAVTLLGFVVLDAIKTKLTDLFKKEDKKVDSKQNENVVGEGEVPKDPLHASTYTMHQQMHIHPSVSAPRLTASSNDPVHCSSETEKANSQNSQKMREPSTVIKRTPVATRPAQQASISTESPQQEREGVDPSSHNHLLGG